MDKLYNNKSLLRAALLVSIKCLIPTTVGMLAAILIGHYFELCACRTIIISVFLGYTFLILVLLLPNLNLGPSHESSSLLFDSADSVISTTAIIATMNYVNYHFGVIAEGSSLNYLLLFVFLLSMVTALLVAVPINFWLLVQEIDAVS